MSQILTLELSDRVYETLAQQAEICGSGDGYFMLEINNYSGHFIPNRNSLEIGKGFRQRE